jgi:hypothetical protein
VAITCIDDAVNVHLDNRLEQLEGRLQNVIAKSISAALTSGSVQMPSVNVMGVNARDGNGLQAASDSLPLGTGPSAPQPPGSAGTPGVHFRTG